MMKEILLYGTSANPPTGMQGHMGAIHYCQQMGVFDEIWLLPVYQHIFSSKRQLAPYDLRVNMCRLATSAVFSDENTSERTLVKVKESERELFEHLLAETGAKPDELRIGSIDLVRFLTAKHPEAAFTFLLGADTFADLCAGKWKEGDKLQQMVKFLVMNRQGVAAISIPDSTQNDSEQSVDDNVRFITVPGLTDVSSTKVRATLDAKELRTLVVPAVADYIVENKLYAFAEE